MPRRERAPAAGQAPARTGPLLTILPTDVYDVPGAMAALKLTKSTVGREVREGRLRIAKRPGRYYLLGAWLLEWLQAGELPPRRRHRVNEVGA